MTTKPAWILAYVLPIAFSACTGDSGESDRGLLEGKADAVIGSCVASDCGGQSSDGEGWCDDSCAWYGDCSDGVAEICGFHECLDDAGCDADQHCLLDDANRCESVEPIFCEDGTIATETSYMESEDGKECVGSTHHCLTNDLDACPALNPLPPDFCSDGTVVVGQPSYIPSADGKECRMSSVHCLTNDLDSCPALSPLPEDFCDDGTAVAGPPSYIPSADGKECRMSSVHCLTNDLDTCP